MKDYGKLKTISFLSVVSVFMLIVFISGCTQSQNTVNSGSIDTEEVSGLPVYPGSQESTQYQMLIKMMGFSEQFSEIHGYVLDGVSPDDIINWYKSKLSDYEIKDQKTVSVQGVTYILLELRKENTLIGVLAFEQNGKVVYFIGRVIIPEESTSLPEHDTATGEEPVERYPGSVMLSYEKSGKPTDLWIYIDYGTKDDAETVSEWYEQYLKNNGWRVTSKSSGTAGYYEDFKKDGESLSISIYKKTETIPYIEISLTYHKVGIPEEDLVSGYEPIPRYPDSIMVEYTNMSYNNVININIRYETRDSLEDVKNWYVSTLSDQGWTVGGINLSPGMVEIGFIKDGTTTLQITIERDGNNITSIDVLYTALG